MKILAFVWGLGLTAVYARDPLVIQIGNVERSESGTMIHIEDPANHFLVETYYKLPEHLTPLFGLKIHEAITTNRGVFEGRRVNILPADHVHEDGFKNRLAFFDFDPDGFLEHYGLFVDPHIWFRKDRFKIEADTPEIQKFFHKVLFGLQTPIPLKTLIVATESLKSPPGLFSPQIIRASYKVQNVAPGHDSSIVVNILRSYDLKGQLVDLVPAVNHVVGDSDGNILSSRNLALLRARVVNPTESGSLFQVAVPCRNFMHRLRFLEGGIIPR